VIIVRNAEAFEDATTDALLKVLEFDAAHTIFVMTTTNIDTLRSPVRSRCQAYRLRPLSKADAKERLIRLCEQENVVYDPVALEIMAAHAGNRAGDLLLRLCKVASGGTVTVARVEEIFGLKWTDAMLNYWRSLLERNEKESLRAFADVGENAEDRIERLRAFIHLVGAVGSHRTASTNFVLDPALVHMPSDKYGFVVEGLSERADQRGSSLDKMWTEIARFWTNSNSQEEFGLHQDLLQFYRLMNA